jgi:hypothetical protein
MTWILFHSCNKSAGQQGQQQKLSRLLPHLMMTMLRSKTASQTTLQRTKTALLVMSPLHGILSRGEGRQQQQPQAAPLLLLLLMMMKMMMMMMMMMIQWQMTLQKMRWGMQSQSKQMLMRRA